MSSISKIPQTNERNLWNLCRFCGAQHNQDNPINEKFLEVIKKLFSFSIETLKTYKNCDECYAYIEYICKFYEQVENVSETFFKVKISTKIVQLPPLYELNSNTIFNDRQDDSFPEITKVNRNKFYSPVNEAKEPNIASVKEITQVDVDDHNYVPQIDIAINNEILEDFDIAKHADVSQIDIVTEVFHVDEHYDVSGIEVVTNPCSSHQKQNEATDDNFDGNETQQIIEMIKQETVNEIENAVNCKETCSNNKFECKICGKILRTRTCLKFHQKLHMTEEEKQANFFKCRHCGKMYPERKTLKSHIKFKHTEEKKGEYVCNICGKMFIYQCSLRAHQKVVHKIVPRKPEHNNNERKYKCELCEKLFKRKYHLNQHRRTHMSAEQKQLHHVICLYCDNRYSTKRSLQFHIESKHLNVPHNTNEIARQYKRKECICDICKKVLSSQSSLLSHLNRVHKNIKGAHSRDYEWACEICGKVYYSTQKLKIHQIVHMSDEEKQQAKIHKCPHCDVKYLRRDSLRVHIESKHSKENPFVCKICDKVFAYRSCLALHQKTFHDKIKPEWRCEICSKTFLHKRSLSNHKKIHEQCE